ncbi:MAG: OmpA family protein [Xanthomonadales bacterium]|nr:OmpA family protein [Xanthomonadales bacterium]
MKSQLQLLPFTLLLLAGTHAFATEETPAQDLLSFAAGALPVKQGGHAEALRVGDAQAISAIDGNPTGYTLTPRPGGPDTVVTMTFELPAPTRFTHFEVPNVLETPSPSQTFVGRLEILGSSEGPDSGFDPLGAVDFSTHEARGQVTRFDAVGERSVDWVRLVFSGGLDLQREQTFFEFSELRGFGAQAPVPMSDQFTGRWRDRGVRLELQQSGSLVNGCYDDRGRLSGSVTGRTLYASGINASDGTPSSFILTVDGEGAIQGLRSSNGAPFRAYSGPATATSGIADCDVTPSPELGCDSVVYGLRFAFDSATLLPGSEESLTALVKGLGSSDVSVIVVEGHSSSEGDEAYNMGLSQRRAEAVVAALAERGLDPRRLSAQGFGETRPLASNEDEAGRTLNRRVEIRCPA